MRDGLFSTRAYFLTCAPPTACPCTQRKQHTASRGEGTGGMFGGAEAAAGGGEELPAGPELRPVFPPEGHVFAHPDDVQARAARAQPARRASVRARPRTAVDASLGGCGWTRRDSDGLRQA